MNEKYQVGQTVYFDYKGSNIKAQVIRVNTKTLSIVAGAIKGRIGYGAVSTSPQEVNKLPNFERTEHKTQKELEVLMEEVKNDFSHIFGSIFNELELEMLETVRITWGTQYTYRLLGTYYHFKKERNFENEKHNLVRISRSLQIAPNFVVKKTLYHELLHIKFHGHGPEFRRYEHKYPQFEEADKYESLLCTEIRKYGMVRIFKLPITKEEIEEDVEDDTPDEYENDLTDKEKIIKKAKELNVFPHYMNEYFMDEYDFRFLELQIKKHKNM